LPVESQPGHKLQLTACTMVSMAYHLASFSEPDVATAPLFTHPAEALDAPNATAAAQVSAAIRTALIHPS
jgi:hypothetical protein